MAFIASDRQMTRMAVSGSAEVSRVHAARGSGSSKESSTSKAVRAEGGMGAGRARQRRAAAASGVVALEGGVREGGMEMPRPSKGKSETE